MLNLPGKWNFFSLLDYNSELFLKFQWEKTCWKTYGNGKKNYYMIITAIYIGNFNQIYMLKPT